ncbi:MAG: hypothetical protein IT529_10645 [Burkholderiales bacterium]|nr:hypothetical protein [Burkholderiales bacterium]
MISPRGLYWRLLVSGVLSSILYFLLYWHEEAIMATSTRTDGLYPALPVVVALVFSFVHGAFTGYFWEALGVTAHKRKG